jgi:hypothetical protein
MTTAKLPRAGLGPSARRLVGLSLLAMVVGLAALVLGLVIPERHDGLEDTFEWLLALLLTVHAVATAAAVAAQRLHAPGRGYGHRAPVINPAPARTRALHNPGSRTGR